MASKGPKRESLSRYFKDLDEFEDSDGDSDDETSQVDGTSEEKSRDVTIIKNNNSVNKSTSDNNKLAGKLAPAELETEKELPPSTITSSTTSSNLSNRRADVDVDTEKKNKLPSASECLSTRSNPTFLKISETKEINWDAREKRLGGGDDHDAVATNLTTNAVPPPSSYEPITDPGIKVVDSEGRKRKTVWSDLEDQNTSTKAYKVHKDGGGDDDEGGDGS